MSPCEKQLKALNRIRSETGYRSSTEVKVAKKLSALLEDVRLCYEVVDVNYEVRINRIYRPDFIIPSKAMIIEVKGRFVAEDRKKLLLVKQLHPFLDIRLVFDAPNTKLSRSSKTTYGAWADKHGFLWCSEKDFFPEDWLNHIPSPQQLGAFDDILNNNSARFRVCKA